MMVPLGHVVAFAVVGLTLYHSRNYEDQSMHIAMRWLMGAMVVGVIFEALA